MAISKIEFVDEITDITNDNIDVLVENEDGYTYVVVVGTPQDLIEKLQEAPKSAEYKILTKADMRSEGRRPVDL